jgi:hypothetical protein
LLDDRTHTLMNLAIWRLDLEPIVHDGPPFA